MVTLGRVWYTDDNAIVRQKVDEAVREQRAPLLNEIVRQGIREGAFTIAYPDQAGDVILSLLQGMGNAHAKHSESQKRSRFRPPTADHRPLYPAVGGLLSAV